MDYTCTYMYIMMTDVAQFKFQINASRIPRQTDWLTDRQKDRLRILLYNWYNIYLFIFYFYG